MGREVILGLHGFSADSSRQMHDAGVCVRVLARYRELTGLPLLINTSFNMHEEPIVCSPADAVDVFTRGAADVLAIGRFVVRSEEVR